MRDNRIGKFYVADYMVMEKGMNFEKILCELKFIPLRVESRPFENNFEYIGISHYFEKVPHGQKVPEYEFTYTSTDNEVSINEVVNRI